MLYCTRTVRSKPFDITSYDADIYVCVVDDVLRKPESECRASMIINTPDIVTNNYQNY